MELPQAFVEAARHVLHVHKTVLCASIHDNFGIDYARSPTVQEPGYYNDAYWYKHDAVYTLTLTLAAIRLQQLHTE